MVGEPLYTFRAHVRVCQHFGNFVEFFLNEHRLLMGETVFANFFQTWSIGKQESGELAQFLVGCKFPHIIDHVRRHFLAQLCWNFFVSLQQKGRHTSEVFVCLRHHWLPQTEFFLASRVVGVGFHLSLLYQVAGPFE